MFDINANDSKNTVFASIGITVTGLNCTPQNFVATPSSLTLT